MGRERRLEVPDCRCYCLRQAKIRVFQEGELELVVLADADERAGGVEALAGGGVSVGWTVRARGSRTSARRKNAKR